MQQGFTDIEQVTEHAIAGVEAEAKFLASAAAATGVTAAEFIGQLNANAVAQLAATVTTDVTDIEQMVEQAMATVENQIRLLGDEVVVDTQRLVNQITDTTTNTLNEAKTFTTVAVTALAPSVATQVLTQVERDLGPIKTEVDQCLTPLCDAVKPNFNHLKDLLDLLKALADIFALGLLTALLVAAIENPKAAGDAVRTTMGWAITAGDDMAKLLFGLAGVKL
jgi:hypothetical protein